MKYVYLGASLRHFWCFYDNSKHSAAKLRNLCTALLWHYGLLLHTSQWHSLLWLWQYSKCWHWHGECEQVVPLRQFLFAVPLQWYLLRLPNCSLGSVSVFSQAPVHFKCCRDQLCSSPSSHQHLHACLAWLGLPWECFFQCLSAHSYCLSSLGGLVTLWCRQLSCRADVSWLLRALIWELHTHAHSVLSKQHF